jgi:hypothetical protein
MERAAHAVSVGMRRAEAEQGLCSPHFVGRPVAAPARRGDWVARQAPIVRGVIGIFMVEPMAHEMLFDV